jgi:carbon-monoxide dehydrogenase large subunit
MTEIAGRACESGIGPISQALLSRAVAHPSVKANQFPMSIQTTASDRSHFGIGDRVLRTEDPKLLRGEGRYTDDINLPRQAYAYIVRSTVAHGRIKSIGTSAAKAMKGVLGVFTGEDIKAYGTLQSALPFKSKDGTDLKKPPRAALPTDKVRFVGDPIACVVAETLLQAKDAAEALEIDIEPLPVVTKPAQAVAKDAPAIFEDVPGNVCLDSTMATAKRSKPPSRGAKHKVKLTIQNTPMIVNTIEAPRAIGSYDKTKEHYTLTSCSQGVMGHQGRHHRGDEDHTGQGADCHRQRRRLVRHEGVSLSEYICILHAAKTLGRPVKWNRRALSRASSPDNHGRAHEQTAELALDEDGTLPRAPARRLRQPRRLPGRDVAAAADAQHRAQRHQPLPHAAARSVDQVRVHQHELRQPLSRRRPARGQLLHGAADRLRAAESGFDRIELRRKNQIRKSEIPWKSAPAPPMTAATSRRS